MRASSWLRKIRKSLERSPIFPALNVPIRAAQSFKMYLWPRLSLWISWLFSSREDTNFTYDLLPVNRGNMAATLAASFNVPFSLVLKYFEELENDKKLKEHIEQVIGRSPMRYRADLEARYGRRMAWYAIARIIKPQVIVETGVDKGLGAVVLCSALIRNIREGNPGEYFGLDINPTAGILLDNPYSTAGSIIYGDSIELLSSFPKAIDLYINDSEHAADYESAEYEMAKSKLSDRAVIISDNSHVTDRLLQFSLSHGRNFVFINEVPSRHWYSGGGLGLSLPSTIIGSWKRQ